MTSRGARTARGVAIAALATFVASLAHTLGGGAPPGPVAVMLALAFSAPLAMLLAGRRARLLRTSVAAVVAQGALHLCYAVVGGASVAVPAPGHSAHLGGAGLGAFTDAPVVDHGHALMPIAHLVAAAITVVALALADDAVRVLARVVRTFVRRLASLPVAVIVSTPRFAADGWRPVFITAPLRASLWSRGPPRVVVVTA